MIPHAGLRTDRHYAGLTLYAPQAAMAERSRLRVSMADPPCRSRGAQLVSGSSRVEKSEAIPVFPSSLGG